MAGQLFKAPGTVLNQRFVIDNVLGQGGMGAVYQCHHKVLQHQKVAIKELHANISNGERRKKAIAQFQHEAKLLFALDHPNLIRVLDYFEEGQSQFLVLELVEGSSLDSYCREPPDTLDPSTVLSWTLEICDALQYLHTLSPPLIFRDLKPANIMQDLSGHIRLVDFGIARYLEPETPTESFLKGSGTMGYSPPEQHTGHTDRRSDIYSLGATMYALLTGQVPPVSLARTFEDTIEPIREINPEVSEALEQTVMHMLQVKPEDRPQTIQDVRDELFGQKTWTPAPAPPPPPESAAPVLPVAPVRRRPTPWLPVVAACAVVFVGAGWGLRHGGPGPVPIASPVATARTGSLSVDTSPQGSAVMVDNTLRGVSPLNVGGLLPGSHTLQVTKAGYVPINLVVQTTVAQIMPIQLTLPVASPVPQPSASAAVAQATPAPAPSPIVVPAQTASPATTPTTAILIVESDPPGAIVLLDNVDRGRTPVTLTNLPLVPHDVEINKAGFEPLQERITLQAVNPQKLSVKLDALGTLVMAGVPSNARVTIDGAVQQGSVLQVEPGRHQVLVTAAGLENFTRSVDVAAGQKVQVAVHMAVPPRQTVILSAPAPGSGVDGHVSDPEVPHPAHTAAYVPPPPPPPRRPTPVSGVVVTERKDTLPVPPAPSSAATSGIQGLTP